MSTAIAKRSSSLPVPIQNLLAGVQPVALAKTGAAVGAGFIAPMLGGKLAKQIDAVEQFAAGGKPQEILVDMLAGLALDGVAVTGVWLATKNEGNETALKVAKLMVVGTLLGSIIPNVAVELADGIEKAVDFVMGLFGGGAKGAPGGLADAYDAVADARHQLPGGTLYELSPGGTLYPLSGV